MNTYPLIGEDPEDTLITVKDVDDFVAKTLSEYQFRQFKEKTYHPCLGAMAKIIDCTNYALEYEKTRIFEQDKESGENHDYLVSQLTAMQDALNDEEV